MVYPDIHTDLLIIIKPPISLLYLHETLGKHLEKTGLTIEVKEATDEKNEFGRTEWISPLSLITLYIFDNFLKKHFEKDTAEAQIFYEKFKVMIKLLANSPDIDPDAKERRPMATFSVFYSTKEKFVLQFLFDKSQNEEHHQQALRAVFEWITSYNSSESASDERSSIKKTYAPDNQIRYLVYDGARWGVLDPLLGFSREINLGYKAKADRRIKKPFVILHQNDFRKYFVMDTNWVLKFDGLETLMLVPNDVSLYASICVKQLKQAREFYEKTIVPRFKQYYGHIPPIEKQTEYFDYFELIISSLIFSYTALEAFANICIPEDFEYRFEKNGRKKVHSKEYIERYYRLEDKFIKVLPGILKCSDPAKEYWWANFKKLEDLRHEIIHTKPSRSEDRYSELLMREIFDIIGTYRECIQFFGFYIAKNSKALLEEYPYDFGHDEFQPTLAPDEIYNDFYRELHNTDDQRKT